MGAINNAFNKAAAGVAAMAYANDSIEKEKVRLAKEDIDLKQEEIDIANQKADIENDDTYKLLQLATEKGKTEQDKTVAAKELQKYQEALNVLKLKSMANKVQREAWKKRWARFGGKL